METQELDLFISKNQIAMFDDKTLEESQSLPKAILSPKNHDYVNEEVLFVVAKVYNEEFVHDFPNLRICGKSITEWVLMAGSGTQQMLIDDSEDLIDRLKTIQTDRKYIAVFYSDTPFLDKNSFYRIMDYFCSRDMNILTLVRGFIVKTDFLKKASGPLQSVVNNIEEEELLKVDNARRLNYVNNAIRDKIISYHLKNGVVIFDEESVFIDADVEIESGVLIYAQNVIKGNTIIEKGAIPIDEDWDGDIRRLSQPVVSNLKENGTEFSSPETNVQMSLFDTIG